MYGNVQPKLALVGCHGDSLPPSLYHSISPPMHPCRNEWEPPDKKVDTRKYRAEPKSILSTSQESLQCWSWGDRYDALYTYMFGCWCWWCRPVHAVWHCKSWFLPVSLTRTAHSQLCVSGSLIKWLGRWLYWRPFSMWYVAYISCVFSHTVHTVMLEYRK